MRFVANIDVCRPCCPTVVHETVRTEESTIYNDRLPARSLSKSANARSTPRAGAEFTCVNTLQSAGVSHVCLLARYACPSPNTCSTVEDASPDAPKEFVAGESAYHKQQRSVHGSVWRNSKRRRERRVSRRERVRRRNTIEKASGGARW